MNKLPESLIPLKIIASGKFTTSSTTVPADTGRGEATNFFNGCIIMPVEGAIAYQPRTILSHSSVGDVFTLETAFTAAPGLVKYVILPAQAVSATSLAAIKTATDKLAGAAVVASSTTANWNTATGTSGLAGEDIVSFGTTATVQKLRYLKIGIAACTAAAVIHVRLYNVDTGIKFYDEQYVRQADALASSPDELEIANNHYIMGVVRVEAYSNTSESVAITYKYQLEAT